MQGLEIQGPWSHGVFQKKMRTYLTPQDRVFSTRFHYKIKQKRSEVDKCKADSWCKVNPWNTKALTLLAIITSLSVRYLLQAVFAQFSVLPLNLRFLQIMSIFPRPSYKVTYCQETVTMVFFRFFSTGL